MERDGKTPGEIIGMLHLGHSVSEIGDGITFYNDLMKAHACKTQRSELPYIGQVNGVTGCVCDLAFIEHSNGFPMLELLDFVTPEDKTRVYKPGEPAYIHIGYTVHDIEAAYNNLTKAGLKPLGKPESVDYIAGGDRKAFFVKDSDGTYVQIMQSEKYIEGDGEILGHDHVCLSVADIDTESKMFAELLDFTVSVKDTKNSTYLNSVCEKAPARVAVCRSNLEDYTIELWETKEAGDVENVMISSRGCVHLCFVCKGIDDLYEKFSAKGMRFVNEPVLVTAGANGGSKAIFFHTPGSLWIELLCRKENL